MILPADMCKLLGLESTIDKEGEEAILDTDDFLPQYCANHITGSAIDPTATSTAS